MTKAERSESKQGHLQPHSLAVIGQVNKHTTVKWPVTEQCITTWNLSEHMIDPCS